MALTSKTLSLAIALPLAALLAILSGLSLIASVVAAPSERDMEQLRRGHMLSSTALNAAIEDNVTAARFFESGRYLANAAAASLALTPAQQRIAGLKPEDYVVSSLSDSPASPYNWNRLAYLRAVRGDRAGAEKAWQMSVLTGRYEPNIMVGRVSLAIQMFPIADPDMIDMLIDQVRLTAQLDPRRLAETMVDIGGGPFVSVVLADDPALSQAFDKYYRRLLRMKGWKARGR
jgi:hypothetical protein